MIQTTNHKLVQMLLVEGANYHCNGGLINLHALLCDELNMIPTEAWQLLLECELCKNQKYIIEHELRRFHLDSEKNI